MPYTIAVTNQKGGVGKTTTALSLLYALHSLGYHVLGVDLDPQGSLGFSAGINIENCSTIYEVFQGTADMSTAVLNTSVGDLVASNILLSAAEIEFGGAGRELLLKRELQKIGHHYDFIIVDTPPALNILTINAYVAADALIIPMVPEILSLLGISQIRETIDNVRQDYNPNLMVLGILLNRFNPRLTLNREVLELAEQVAGGLGTRVFDAKIPAGVAVAEAPAHGESVLTYAPRSRPAQCFKALADEILHVITSPGQTQR